MTAKYREAIRISTAAKKLPQVKLIRLSGVSTDCDEITDQLRRQNRILRDSEFSIVSTYTVNSPRGQYINVILECDLPLLDKIISQRTLIFGFAEIRAFEHVEILQCLKCLSFGHLAGSCKGSVHCRRCAEAHLSAECPTPTTIKCFNCVAANKKGAKYKASHSSTDARCPVRKERIEGLKEFHSKN